MPVREDPANSRRVTDHCIICFAPLRLAAFAHKASCPQSNMNDLVSKYQQYQEASISHVEGEYDKDAPLEE